MVYNFSNMVFLFLTKYKTYNVHFLKYKKYAHQISSKQDKRFTQTHMQGKIINLLAISNKTNPQGLSEGIKSDRV